MTAEGDFIVYGVCPNPLCDHVWTEPWWDQELLAQSIARGDDEIVLKALPCVKCKADVRPLLPEEAARNREIRQATATFQRARYAGEPCPACDRGNLVVTHGSSGRMLRCDNCGALFEGHTPGWTRTGAEWKPIVPEPQAPEWKEYKPYSQRYLYPPWESQPLTSAAPGPKPPKELPDTEDLINNNKLIEPFLVREEEEKE